MRKRTLLAAAAVLLLPLAAPSGRAEESYDDVVGDIPASATPFDGTDWRASPHDIGKVAAIAYDAVAEASARAGHPEDMEAIVAASLAAAGYPGTRVEASAGAWDPDRRCSTGERIEVRLRFNPDASAVEVVAAGKANVAAVTYQPKSSEDVVVTPVGPCLAQR